MNRSVINWIITAGVLTAGAAVSPPAIADPEGSVPTDGAKPGDDRGAAPRPERATGRSGGDNPAAGRSAADDDQGRFDLHPAAVVIGFG